MQRNSSQNAENNQKSDTELNSRLEEILAHHRNKEERFLNLEIATKDLEQKFNADLEDKEQQHAKRINILQQQIKMVESRNESLQQRNSTLQKERNDSLEEGIQKTKRIEELIKDVDRLEKEVVEKQTRIRERESKIKKLEYDSRQVMGKNEVNEKRMINLEAESIKQAQEIVISQELQEHLNKLLAQKDEQIQAVNEELKKLRAEKNTLSKNLRNQFQEELNKHTRLQETKHEEGIKKLQASLKQENKKKLCKYRESLAEKNHGIENLKETATRLKQINKNLKFEKEKMEKQNNLWENQAKILTKQIENLKEKHAQTLKEKKNLLQDMRSKYLEKSSELGECKSKYKELNKEIQSYRNFVMEEEKALGGYIPDKKDSKSISSMSPPRQVENCNPLKSSKDSAHSYSSILSREDDKRVRKKRKLSHDFTNSSFFESIIFDLCAIDLINGELAIQCCAKQATSLIGWQLTNADHTQIFNFPPISIQPGEKKKIYIGVDCVEEKDAIYWKESIWNGSTSDAIQLIDPQKNVRALVPLNPQLLSGSLDSRCMIM